MSSQPQAKRAFLDTSLAPTAPRTSRPSPRTARISRVATLRARYSGTANQCDSHAPATGTPATFKSNPISPSIPTISSRCHASITLGPGSERPLIKVGSLSFRTDHFNLPEGDSPSPPRTKGFKARLLGREPSGQRALAIRSPSTGRDLGRCKDKLFESPVPLAQGPRDPLDRHDVQPDTQDQGAKSPKAGSWKRVK